MRPKEILEDLFFIERGYLNGNHFVYRSDEPVLIDTAYEGHFDETASHIQSLGIDLSRIRRIISTHTHCDHVGGNGVIQERSGCEIALHRIGRHFIETRDDWSMWWRYFNQAADFFRCERALDDGDVVEVGPHRFRVVYTPGHAADGIVLHHPDERLLISSDTLWEKDMAAINLRVEGSRAVFSMLESIDALAELDVDIVYPGHGAPFTDFQGAVDRARTRLTGFLEDRSRLGNDLLKKITVYTLLMNPGMPEAGFFDHLMSTVWFRETVDLYFDGAYDWKYDEFMSELLQRGIILNDRGRLTTVVKP